MAKSLTPPNSLGTAAPVAKMIGVVIRAVRKYPLSSFLAKSGVKMEAAVVNGFRTTNCAIDEKGILGIGEKGGGKRVIGG